MPPHMTSSKRSRLLTLVAILMATALLLWFLFGTAAGRQWTDQQYVRQVIQSAPTIAPLLFVLVYAVLGCMMIPMWGMQALSGYCFGPIKGAILCTIGGAISAFVTVALAEWMTADMAMRRIEPILTRMRRFQHRLGSTGIPLVMATRLVHVIPFGPSNVAFGLMDIRPRDAAIGTALGVFSGVGFCAVLGSAGPDFKAEWPQVWRMVLVLIAINLTLATPIILKYRKRRRELDLDGAANVTA